MDNLATVVVNDSNSRDIKVKVTSFYHLKQ